MHPLIPIEALVKLSDRELLEVEARLRGLILEEDLDAEDRARCAASLSNTSFVLALRCLTLQP